MPQAIPAVPRSGRLTVELRSPIFGFALDDRLLSAQALDVEQAPAAMVVDCSFWSTATQGPSPGQFGTAKENSPADQVRRCIAGQPKAASSERARFGVVGRALG